MPYTFDPLFAADPNNPAMVAKNAAVLIFDPAVPNVAITITDATGSPIPNPITVNAAGFGPAFQHPTLDRVGWSGGGFENFITSYEGMKQVATDAKTAAQDAAANAGQAAAEDLAARIAAGQFKGNDGANGSNVLPTDTAIEAAILGAGTKTKAALNATFALKSELTDAGIQVVYHLGNAATARPTTTAPVMWVGSVQPTNMIDGDLYMVSVAVEPLTTWHTAYSASTLSLADAAAVSSLTDTTGNGRHAVQATAAKQPKWYAGGGTPYVRFDGVDDFLQTPAFTAPLAQPGTMIMVAKLATITPASSPTKVMVDGRTASAAWSIFQRGVSGNAGSEVFQASAGIPRNGPTADKPVAGQWFIFTFIVNATGSYLRVNGSQTTASDFGAYSFDGITLGSYLNGLGNFSDMDLGEFRLAARALTTTEVADEETYFASKYGITL